MIAPIFSKEMMKFHWQSAEIHGNPMPMNRMVSMLPPLALLLLFRCLGAWQGWANFSPLPAVMLLSFACLQGWQRWLVPLLAWVVSDPLLNLWYGQNLLVWDQWGMILGLGLMLPLAFWLRRDFSLPKALAGLLLGSLSFYLVTNMVSFFALADLYPRSWQGFVQAQWSGPVGFGPTWIFLRNSCAANILFGAIFLLAIQPLSSYFPVRRTSFIEG
jgi:hypothetical protein